MANELQKAIEEHSKDLKKAIDTGVTGDQNDKSFISKDEVGSMLDEHFKRVENLMEQFGEQQNKGISFTDLFQELQDKLKALLNEFSESIKFRVNDAKKNITNQIDNVRDNVNEVKDSANSMIQNTVLGLNEKIKDFSSTIDKKFSQENEIKSTPEEIKVTPEVPKLKPEEIKLSPEDAAKKYINDYFETLDDKSNYEIGRSSNTDNNISVTFDHKTDRGYSSKNIELNLKSGKFKEVNHTVEDQRGNFIQVQYPQKETTLDSSTLKDLNSNKSELEKLKDELSSLKIENKQIQNENRGLQSKIGTVEKFFHQDKGAFKDFNQFLVSDKKMDSPELKNNDKVKELVATKKVDRGMSL